MFKTSVYSPEWETDFSLDGDITSHRVLSLGQIGTIAPVITIESDED